MTPSQRASQVGFTLIEVMIALLVLSIGLLGLAGLQTLSLRNNHMAYLRTQAVFQAYDMIDRMRANATEAALGAYGGISGIPSSPPLCNSTGSPCSPSQLVTYDAYAWNTANAALLPNGVGTVTYNAPLYTVTVKWTEMAKAGLISQSVTRSVTNTYLP